MKKKERKKGSRLFPKTMEAMQVSEPMTTWPQFRGGGKKGSREEKRWKREKKKKIGE